MSLSPADEKLRSLDEEIMFLSGEKLRQEKLQERFGIRVNQATEDLEELIDIKIWSIWALEQDIAATLVA